MSNKEFYLRKIKKLEHVYYPGIFKSLMGMPTIFIHKYGIVVINDKGETREIWEK